MKFQEYLEENTKSQMDRREYMMNKQREFDDAKDYIKKIESKTKKKLNQGDIKKLIDVLGTDGLNLLLK